MKILFKNFSFANSLSPFSRVRPIFKTAMLNPGVRSFSSFAEDKKGLVESEIKKIKFDDGSSLIDKNLYYGINYNETSNIVKILVNLNKDFRKVKNLIESKFKENPLDELKGLQFEVSMAPQVKKNEPKSKPGLSKVKNIIAVSSCKGGVGKSTIAVNLAFSLLQRGQKVGIFDADVYGPSLPTLINAKDTTLRSYEDNPNVIIPVEFSGVKVMSFGFAAPGKRAIMRGPIVSNVVTQLVSFTDWGELDYLVVDLPPGTGDIQISLCQELNFKGAVVITTPQKLSFIDVVKGIEMFDELKIPVLSVIENMSYFTCDNCDKKHHIFGQGYLGMLKKQFGIENSFSIPINPVVSRFSDLGSPYVMVAPETDDAQGVFQEISEKLIESVKKVDELVATKPQVDFDPRDSTVDITFKDEAGDEHVKKVSALHLRKKCICAACVDEFSGEKLLKEKQIPADVKPTKIEDKGNYAVAIVWSDGHRSSIYPFKRLLSDEIESIN